MENDTQEQILFELKQLNEKTAKHNSFRGTFMTGVIYGIGFFVGSAILATILLGILSPWIGEIDWVRENYERGTSLSNVYLHTSEERTVF
jgi:hypothetical protein